MAEEPFSPPQPAQPGVGEQFPALDPGERVLQDETGVLLGWQARTILIWWLPGAVFIALSQLEFHSWVVTAGLAVFCILLFGFYASDREVRPRSGARRYRLTNRRLLIGGKGGDLGWRTVAVSEMATTRMENGLMDRAVARLSGAATIVIELATAGPRGEPQRVRIGPMRRPHEFRRALDSALRDRLPTGV